MNIFKMASGDLTRLLTERPFLPGELFIQTVNKDNLSESYLGASVKLKDAVTGVEIKQLKAGEIYSGAGYGLSYKANDANLGDCYPIYMLGSGASLKLANNISDNLITSLNTASINRIKSNPNNLYIFIGDSDLVVKDDCIILGEDPSSTLDQTVDKGDLLFYSPSYGKILVLHLSRTNSNLTKIVKDDLTSNSLKNEIGDNENYNLTDFLNGVATHYQYLDNVEGWVELKDAHLDTGNVVFDELTEGSIRQGKIFRVPYVVDIESQTIKLEPNTFYDFGALKVKPGDLLFASDDNNGVANLKVIPLFRGLNQLAGLDGFTIERADAFATFRNKDQDNVLINKLTTDPNVGVKEVLVDLYKTKADIDINTGKIPVSQLPNSIFGGLSLIGNISATDFPNEISTAQTVIRQKIINKWNAVLDTAISLDILDTNPEELTIEFEGKNVAQEILTELTNLVGKYFIWTGESAYIKDEGSEVKVNRAYFSEEALAGIDDANNLDSQVSVMLNPGDFLIFNGRAFDVVDNSSSMVGIDVNGQILTGVPKIIGYNPDSVDIIKVEKTLDDTIKISGPKLTWFEDLYSGVYHPIFNEKSFVQIDSNSNKLIRSNVRAESNTVGDSGKLILGASYQINYAAVQNESDEYITVNLTLPTSDGVLATEGYVDNKVSELEAEIENSLQSLTENGTVDYLQTIAEIDGVKVLVNSIAKQAVTETSKSIDIDGNVITVKTDISEDYNTRPTWHNNVYWDVINKKVAGIPITGEGHIVLPKHDGVILTSESVIDCGTWF